MNSTLNKKYLFIYLCIWITINILTAYCTELYPDEAYYWLYSKFLDWGYFDHPPMVGLVINSTSFLGQNEFAVRLPFILLTTITLYITYKLSKVDVHLFFITIFSLFSLNIIGFMALPDAAFLFFGVLFIYLYKNYLQNRNLLTAIALGIVGALLLYSKYHGILIIGFTLLSNVKLLKEGKTYLIGLIILVLFIPHLWWQYQHDFPSYTYHMVERSSKSYQFKFTLTYLFSIIFFHGPLLGTVLLWLSFKKPTNDFFEKALKWNLFGTIAFFFISSFKGHVEPNWTIFVIIPLILLGLTELEQRKKWLNLYIKGSIFFIIILIGIRIHFINPLFEFKKDRIWEFHNNSKFAKNVFDLANGKPVVANRYQEASILSFYAPTKNHYIPALNIDSRSNQFNIWQLDKNLEGEKVLFVNNYLKDGIELLGIKKKQTVFLNWIDTLPRTTGYSLKCDRVIFEDNKVNIDINVIAPDNLKISDDKTQISIHIEDKNGKMRYPGRKIKPGNSTLTIDLMKDDKKITLYLVSDRLKGSVRAYKSFTLPEKK